LAAEIGGTKVRNQLVERNANEVGGERQVGGEQAGIGRNASQFVQAAELR
jgi:hypothetical protein